MLHFLTLLSIPNSGALAEDQVNIGGRIMKLEHVTQNGLQNGREANYAGFARSRLARECSKASSGTRKREGLFPKSSADSDMTGLFFKEWRLIAILPNVDMESYSDTSCTVRRHQGAARL